MDGKLAYKQSSEIIRNWEVDGYEGSCHYVQQAMGTFERYGNKKLGNGIFV